MVSLEIGIFCVLLASSLAVPILQSRIYGGSNAEDGQFPHQISLRVENLHGCGGSIIADKWVVTAAHCLQNAVELYTVLAGTISRSEGGTVAKVQRLIVHGKIDIGLVELSEPLKFSKNINSIKIVEKEVPDGGDITISGWGEMSNGTGPDILQYSTDIKKLATQDCKDIMGIYYTDALICLEHPVGVGSCFADSGGPASYRGELAGVSSFGLGDCGTHYPDGYMKVYYVRDWINEKTGLEL